MKTMLAAVVLGMVTAATAICQESTRESSFRQIRDLRTQIDQLEDEFLQPADEDIRQAASAGLDVVRLMPRETYDGKMFIQGGGSYFSFTTRSHDYQKIAQIGLEQNNLRVSFAWADYGFLIDLGEKPLTGIDETTPEAKFMLDYVAASDEPVARAEYRKFQGSRSEGPTYRNVLPAVVGHSYLLRAISYSKADVMVALRIMRKDADGSLVLFWKMMKTFPKPELKRVPDPG